MKKDGNGRIFVSITLDQIKQAQDEWIKSVLFDKKPKSKKSNKIVKK
jgi:hypothetical protein